MPMTADEAEQIVDAIGIAVAQFVNDWHALGGETRVEAYDPAKMKAARERLKETLMRVAAG